MAVDRLPGRDAVTGQTGGHPSVDAAPAHASQTPAPETPAPPVLHGLSTPDPAVGDAARASTISAAHATIGTARLNRLMNPPVGADRRLPSAQPVDTLPIGAAEATHAPTGGQPMDTPVRARVEHTLGADLSMVRVHSGPEAHAAAESLSTRAFTWGSDVFLGPGQNPSDARLMAHEAAHVVQQQRARTIQRDTPSGGGPLEQEARDAAAASEAGRRHPVTGRAPGPLQRDGGGVIPARVAGWLRDHLSAIPGYALLALVIGRDPITQDPVQGTPVAVVRAVAALIPGGTTLVDNLVAAGTLQRAADWFFTEVAKLGMSEATVHQLLARAWNAVSLLDLLDPAAALQKVAPILAAPLERLRAFAAAAGEKLLELVFEGALALAGAGGQRVLGLLRKVGDVFGLIVANPLGFLGNLLAAVKGGFIKFLAHIGQHLKQGLFEWLTVGLGGALRLPEKWDPRGILSVVLQVLGLTYQSLRSKLVRLVGERVVAGIETAVDFVKTIATGGLAAAWQKLLEFAGNLLDTVIGGIRDWVVTSIIRAAITKLVTMFNPVGAIVQGIITIYDTVMFFMQRAQQIGALVEAITDSLASIARGNIAAAVQHVETTLARTVPTIIGFLARLIGLADVAEAVKAIIHKVQAAVGGALDRLAVWVVGTPRSIASRVGAPRAETASRPGSPAVGEAGLPEKEFDADGEHHRLFIVREGDRAVPMIASEKRRVADFLTAVAGESQFALGTKRRAALDAASAIAAQLDATANEVAALEKAGKPAATKRRQLGELETGLADQLHIALGGADISKLDQGYLLEGVVGPYGSVPEQRQDRMEADHQPQNSLMKHAAQLRYGKVLLFAGRRLGRYVTADGWAINLHHQRHVWGNTYGKSADPKSVAELDATRLYATPEGARRRVIEVLKLARDSDAQAIERVTDPTTVETADVWSDVRAKIRGNWSAAQAARLALASRIAARVKHGEQKIRQSPMDEFNT